MSRGALARASSASSVVLAAALRRAPAPRHPIDGDRVDREPAGRIDAQPQPLLEILDAQRRERLVAVAPEDADRDE